jgi:hypothetical protein
LKDHGNSERDQHNYLKVLIPFALYLGPNTSLSAVYDQAQVTAFLNTKKKDLAVDRDQKWIVTWNSYLARIRHFYRGLYSQRHREPIPQEEWETPHLVKIRDKKTKRQSPYDVAQIWDLHEMLRILPYATHIRNKAAITLFWDLNARNHKITKLAIHDVRLRENYGEGEIPKEGYELIIPV